MIKYNLTRAAAAGFSLTAIALLMSACGDGGGIPATYPAKVSDGYVKDAEIWVDQDPVDGVCETDTKQKTDATGGFSLTGYTEYMVCAKNGTDISTGALFVGELKAPPGATQITPLTTLVQATVAADKAAGKVTSPADAAKTIATNLGLGDTDILTNDPVLVVGTNPKLAKTTAAVQVLLIQVANNVVAATTGVAVTPAQTSALLGSAIKGLADAIVKAAKPVDLTSNASVTNDVNSLVKTAISNTVTLAQKDTVVVSAVSKIADIDASNVASVAVAQVLALAQNVAMESAENLVAVRDFTKMPVTLLSQTDTSAAVSIALNSGTLTTSVAKSISSATVAAIAVATKSYSDALIGGITAAIDAAIVTVNGQIAKVASEAKITIPPVTKPVYVRPTVSTTTTTTTTTTLKSTTTTTSLPTTTTTTTSTTLPTTTTTTTTTTLPNNVLVLSAPVVNTIAVSTTGGSPYPVTVQGPLTKASLTLTALGTPVLPKNVDVGFEMTDATRVFKVVIKGATINANYSVTVPDTATLQAYVKNAGGVENAVVIGNVTVNNILRSTDNVMTVDWSNALASVATHTGFSALNLAQPGVYNVTIALSGASFALQPSGASAFSAPSTAVTMPTVSGVTGTTVSGQGASFKVTVQ